RAEPLVGFLNLRDDLMARPMEGSGGQNQDRGINEQAKHERVRRIDGCEFDRLPSAGRRLFELSRLHDARVQIEIVRHYGRTKDAHGDVKHSLIGDDLASWHETGQNPCQLWFRKNQLSSETTADIGS